MAGSKEDLEAAIARKQVMTADTKAGILFFFPKIQIEWKKTWAAEETYSQKQEGNQLDYQAYSSAITSFLPGVSDLALSGAAAGSVASSSQNMLSIGQPLAIQNAPVTGVAELQVQLDKLTKQVIPLGEKVQKMVATLSSPAARISQSLHVVVEQLERAEKIKMELAFAVKFNKDMTSNKAITSDSALLLKGTSETVCLKLIEETKIIRALMKEDKAFP